MKPQLNPAETAPAEVKFYSCFICDDKSTEKGIPLLRSQTAFSRISLGEKLQEVLGPKYLVLTSVKDKICWDCASYINWIDRCEHKIDLMKEYIVDKISSKYKKIEVNLSEPTEEVYGAPPPPVEKAPKPPPPTAPAKVLQQQYEEETIDDGYGANRRKKDYCCKFCGKEYVSLVSLTLHIQRMHGVKEKCNECGAKFDTRTKLKRHIKYYHAPQDKELSCVSCGFHTTNTEIYCRHVCNSSIVSLTCISCNKRYVDSNYRQDSGTYQCQACQAEAAMAPAPQVEERVPTPPPPEPSPPPQQPQQDELSNAELVNQIPEFFKETDLPGGDSLDKNDEEESSAYLRCEGCEEQFKLRDLTQHSCFIRGESVAFCEVEPPSKMKYPKEATILQCKSCGFQFSDIESLRDHWDQTGHTREVNTHRAELNRIKDKYKKTEATFKVVKQNFNMRATVPGQIDEALRVGDDYKDMFVKVSDKKTDPIEEFVKRDGSSCGTCGLTFESTDLLENHQKNECLKCVTCNVSFYDNKLLKKHYLYTGHASKLRVADVPPRPMIVRSALGFKCHRCVKTFASRFLLREHFQIHYRGTNKGACQYCLLEFENKNDIQQHVLEVHGAHLYKCSHCERTFMSEAFRNKHEAKHKNKLPVECGICNIKLHSQRSLVLHIETYHRGNSCRLCGKVIEDPIALRKHERRHYFDRGLECGLCKKRFRNKTALKAHSHIHSTDEMKFQCEVCALGFSTEETLLEHRLSHVKPEKYKCVRCNSTFSSRAQFWMHLKSHENSFLCTVCKRGFRDTSLLAIHRRKHWRVRPYQCPQCNRTFSVAATLRRHLHVHTRMFPHRCGLCKRGFLTKYAYHRHTETVHAVSNSYPPPRRPNIPSLPLNATDEDIFQAADTLDSLMFNDYQSSKEPPTTDLITNEVIVETTELFDEILN